MKKPKLTPPLEAVLRDLPTARLGELGAHLQPELDGRYLHHSELRRRTPPKGVTPAQWWALISFARIGRRNDTGLVDVDGAPFGWVRTDSVDRLLHRIDREAGTRLEAESPSLASPKARDRYLLDSLAEEAVTSSQLEGASTTRRVATEMLASGRPPRTRDERMISNNFRAMQLARERVKSPLTMSLLLELHAVLTEGTLDDAGDVGRLRGSDDAVVVQSHDTGSVVHVPPPAEALRERLEHVFRFANEDPDVRFVHPMVRAIALHFALAYEHPFVDGNGRTARALFYWSLLRSGYWLAEFISISREIQKAPARYAEAFVLTETDNGDLTYFVLHQLGVVQRSIEALHAHLSRRNSQLAAADVLLGETEAWNDRQREVLSRAMRQADVVFTVAQHQKTHGVSNQTARSDLMGLEKAGLLEHRQRGKKHVFVATEAARRFE